MRIPRIPLFRIWYSTTYTVLLLILLILLALTPADTIYQSIRTRELQKLFVVGAVYLFTALIVVLVYSTRLYTNRTVLAAIPKPYVPVEDGEVGKMVRRMVVKALRRSAIVAWDSRPRDLRAEEKTGVEEDDRQHTSDRNRRRRRSHGHGIDATIIPVSAQSPPWGHVSHPGWASPSSPDLPNLQYANVVCELPNLIEAKAVSLAPPDPVVEHQHQGLHIHENNNATPVLPDAQVVALLQRPRTMGLREYLAHLASLNLLNPPSLGPDFLAQYEYARFSTQPLTESEFRSIMSIFAEILNGMTELDPAVIEEARAAEGDGIMVDTDTRSMTPSQSSHLPAVYRTPLVGQPSEFSYKSNNNEGDSLSAGSPQTVRTAPSMPLGRNVSPSAAYSHPRTPSPAHSQRTGSLYSATGSVIHRSTRRSPSTILPNSSSSSLERWHSDEG